MSKKRIDIDSLSEEYRTNLVQAKAFRDEVNRQIDKLLKSADIALGFPLQSRVKTWSSIESKLERVSLSLDNIFDLQDIIGFRIVLIFKREIKPVCDLITQHFDVVNSYDTLDRLKADQFGYSSHHIIINMPESWKAIPTMKGFPNFKAEVQIRTIAQHMWAEASNLLQYKQEGSVPDTILRSVYRVSALLETVDLEFERVLTERGEYKSSIDPNKTDDELNVDLLEAILVNHMPDIRESNSEQYSDLLDDLLFFGISNSSDLIDIINNHYEDLRQHERKSFDNYILSDKDMLDFYSDLQVKNKIFYSYTGAGRGLLMVKFGDDYDKYINHKIDHIFSRDEKDKQV